jgi:hypothetical protein
MSGQIPCERPFCWQCWLVAAALVAVIAALIWFVA